MKRNVLLTLLVVSALLAGALGVSAAEPTGDAIKIGAIYNLTGAQASLDGPSANGAKLAVKEINAAGGVLGRPVELVLYDGKTDAATIGNSATQLVDSDKVVAMMGFSDSDMVLAAAPIAAQAGVVFVTSGATSPKLPEQVPDYLYLACFGDNVQAAAGAEYAFNTLGAKTSYLLIDKGMEYTLLLGQYFKERFTELGGEIMLEDTYQTGDKDFSAQITKLKALGTMPDMLFISAGPDDVGTIIKQFRDAGMDAPIMGGDGFDTPLLIEIAGKGADNVYFTTHSLIDADLGTEAVKAFMAAYEGEYGTPPENAFAGLGYDTAKLLADAIARAGSDDPAAVRTALSETKDFPGVTGSITYPAGARIPQKGVTIILVKDSKFTLAAELVPEKVPGSAMPPVEPTGEPVKIGAIYNLTGAQASLDGPSANGAKLAVKEVNASGGVLGRPLELVLYDGKTDAATIGNSATQLVDSDKVVAMMGFSDSDMVLAAAPIAAQGGLVFVTSGATSPKLPEQVPDYLYLACFGDNVQAAAGAEYAFNTLAAKTSYLLIDKGMEYTLLLGQYFKERFTELGGEIVLEDTYQTGDKDFSAQITKLKALGTMPDMLFISAGPDDVGTIIKQFRDAGMDAPIMGGDGFDTPLLIEIAGKGADNVYFTTHSLIDAELGSDVVKAFMAAYEGEYGTPPENAFAGLGYDTAKLLADAIARAGSDDPAALRTALSETKDFPGVTGSITYPEGVRIPQKGVTIILVKDGKFTLAAEVVPEKVPAP